MLTSITLQQIIMLQNLQIIVRVNMLLLKTDVPCFNPVEKTFYFKKNLLKFLTLFVNKVFLWNFFPEYIFYILKQNMN